MTDAPKPLVLSFEEVSLMLEEARKKRAKRRDALVEEAKVASPDKEPFDFAKFARIYFPSSVVGSGGLSPDSSEATKSAYLEKYYLGYPDIQTIEEFARKLEEIEAHSGN